MTGGFFDMPPCRWLIYLEQKVEQHRLDSQRRGRLHRDPGHLLDGSQADQADAQRLRSHVHRRRTHVHRFGAQPGPGGQLRPGAQRDPGWQQKQRLQLVQRTLVPDQRPGLGIRVAAVPSDFGLFVFGPLLGDGPDRRRLSSGWQACGDRYQHHYGGRYRDNGTPSVGCHPRYHFAGDVIRLNS